MKFQQQVKPLRRGVSYFINTIHGPKEVHGPRVSEHFAVRRDEDGRPWWVMTHLPSGLMVPRATRRLLYRSRQVAAVLEQCGAWTDRSKRSRREPMIQRAIEEMAKIPDTPRRKRA